MTCPFNASLIAEADACTWVVSISYTPDTLSSVSVPPDGLRPVAAPQKVDGPHLPPKTSKTTGLGKEKQYYK